MCSTELHIIKTHSFKMPPTSFGGSLSVNSSNNIHVQPTNTLDFPDLDQAFVKVRAWFGLYQVFNNIVLDSVRRQILLSIISKYYSR